MEALASKRLVDLWIGGDDRKYMYRNINYKLEMIVKFYDTNKKGVFVEQNSACLHLFQRCSIDQCHIYRYIVRRVRRNG